MYKIIVHIDGMMCGMCESHINNAVRNAFKVKKVVSSYKKGITEILSESEISKESLTPVIEKDGYKIKKYESEIYNKKVLVCLKDKKLLTIFRK